MAKQLPSLYSPKFRPAPAADDGFWNSFHLPIDFLIVGAPKCGTKWVYHCLSASPEILLPSEQNFFTINQDKGAPYYYELYRNADMYKVAGEYSNTYMLDEELPSIFCKLNADMKIIMCCRNPIDRAFSHYLMDIARGSISPQNCSFYETLIHPQTYSYYDFGLYYKHISKYLRVFGQDKLLLLTLDEIKNKPFDSANRLFAFLGVDINIVNKDIMSAKNSWAKKQMMKNKLWQSNIMTQYRTVAASILPDRIRYHISRAMTQIIERKKPVISARAHNFLMESYYLENRKLETVLGKDLSSWNSVA